jgi:hypothetical protein
VATAVHFTRLPITTPCPVPVAPGGATFDDEGEPLPMEQRPELCAVDACWMIGGQRLCDYHLRDLFDRGYFEPGTYDDLCRDTYGEYGSDAVEAAVARSLVPWAERKRYSQDNAQSWHDSAKERGLA